MKKLLLLFLTLIPSGALACMPPFPGEVMIGRISSLNQTQSGKINIDFSSYGFPFRDYTYENPTSWHWQSYSDTNYPSSISVGSLIITLSDYQDGSYPTNYSIFHITTLSCKNNIIQLGKRYGTVMGWDRKNGKCGYEARSLLDVFIDGDESTWIKKLQQKYPTCDSLQKAFPIKQEISIESTKAPSLENDVSIQSTGFTWLDWILSKIDTFFGLF